MKKFLYLANTNKRSESNAYEVSDFINSYSPIGGKPIITGNDGLISASLLPTVPASSLQLVRTAQSAIVSGDAVKAVSSTHVAPADYNNTLSDATVLGIATSSANPGEQVTVVVLGIITFPIFNIFPVNTILFLDEAGGITDVRPVSGYLTIVGKSLGGGAVMVTIGTPTQVV